MRLYCGIIFVAKFYFISESDSLNSLLGNLCAQCARVNDSSRETEEKRERERETPENEIPSKSSHITNNKRKNERTNVHKSVTTHTKMSLLYSIRIDKHPFSHIWDGGLCCVVWWGKVCGKCHATFYFDARAMSCYIFTLSTTLRLHSASLPFALSSSTLSSDFRLSLTSLRCLMFLGGVGEIVGCRVVRAENFIVERRGKEKRLFRKTICGQVGFPFYENFLFTMGGRLSPEFGARKKINFHFKCSDNKLDGLLE